jgi:hypothetical protein
MHSQVQVFVSAGISVIVTDTAPGAHGVVVTGTHGMGVNTPRAAAVADATSGLLGVLHMPKVGMLSIGTKSMMVAAGRPPAVTPVGVALSGAGVKPNEHVIMAPVTTCCPMINSFRWSPAYRPPRAPCR